MKIYNNIKDFSIQEKTCVTIGTFDGVHIGHRRIIEQLGKSAKKNNCRSVVLTFFPHPKMILQKDNQIKLINTIEERVQLFKKLKINNLIIHPFDLKFSRLSALEFTRDILVNQLNLSRLIIGYDHHFGKNREGNIEQLIEYGNLYGFSIEKICAQDINRVSISSTKIRRAIIQRDIQRANKYLGYNYFITGKVIEGNKLGSQIGFPTANIELNDNNKLIPQNGAYVVYSIINGEKKYGMMNIGNRPTLNLSNKTIEVNFFNFQGDLYGKQLQVNLITFLRDEKKFTTIDDLKEQLKRDRFKILNKLSDYKSFENLI